LNEEYRTTSRRAWIEDAINTVLTAFAAGADNADSNGVLRNFAAALVKCRTGLALS
jgi:hypothetical protein